MSHSLIRRQSQGYNQVPLTPNLPSQPRRRNGVRRADMGGTTDKGSEAGKLGHVLGMGGIWPEERVCVRKRDEAGVGTRP